MWINRSQLSKGVAKLKFNEKNWESIIFEKETCSISLNEDSVLIKKDALAGAYVQGFWDFEGDGDVNVTVKYKAKDTSLNGPYGLIAFTDENKNLLFTYYLEYSKAEDSLMEATVTIPENTKYIRLTLGLKSRGEVTFCVPEIKKVESKPHRKAVIASIKLPGTESKEKSMELIASTVEKVAKRGTDLILLSEILNTIGCGKPASEVAETVDGEYASKMKELAKKYNTYIAISLYERGEDNRIYNSAFLIGRGGEIEGVYRKVNISYNDFSKNGVTAGEEYKVFETDFAKVSILTCWDMFFPEPPRIVSQMGAELIVVPTAGYPYHRHISRALENGVYVAVAGYHEKEEGEVPSTKIINPKGEIIASCNKNGEAAICEIDFDEKHLIYHLSIGGSWSDAHNVYMAERVPETFGKILDK